ncbi:MAG: TonB-dependent receptor [Halioglobus sp.]
MSRPTLHRCAAALLCALATSAVSATDDLTENIIVTATRVPESAGRLPLAWSRVDAEAIDEVAAVHINEIMQQVPGAWISRGNGQESLIALRSPVLTGAGSCGAFYTAADSISLRAPGFCNVNQLFDANFEQAGGIEVIKGPATALYGSNAMHGVINILSPAPTAELDHQLSVEAGPYDYYRGKYRYANTQGRHGISININAVTDGGYKDDSGYDQQKATLRHDYDGVNWAIRTVLDAANLNQETAGFIQGEDAYKDSALKDSNPNPEAYRDAWSWRLYTRASRRLNDDHTLVITPYVRDNDMEFLQHFLPWQPVEENAHTSAGLKSALHSDLGQWKLVSGIDLEYTDAMLKEVQDEPFSPNQPAGVHYDYQVDASLAAAYGQLRSQWDSPWELSAGARFEYTNYDYNNRTGDGPACGPEASNCRFFRPADREDDFANWSLNAGVSYRLSDQHLTYLRLAQGFRAPQATELYRLQAGQAVADLDAEEIDNIELGLRGDTLRARYDLSLYYMEKDEVIFQDADRQNISGASTRHYGAELSLDYSFSDAWSLGVDVNAASHTYDSATALLGSSGNIKGNDIDTSPRLFGSARLAWEFSALTGRPGRAQLEWVYMDSYYLEPDNEHEYEGHSLLNLRISSEFSARWSGALRVTNLLDEDYAERADFGFGNYRYFTGQPLGVYGEVTYRFGD